MSVEHLDVLYAEFPDLFQPRDLSPVWDDDLIIIPIEDRARIQQCGRRQLTCSMVSPTSRAE